MRLSLLLFLALFALTFCSNEITRLKPGTPTDTIHITDAPRRFAIINTASDSTLFVAISDSLLQHTITLPDDSILTYKQLLHDYFQNTISVRYHSEADTLTGSVYRQLKSSVRYTNPKDTTADIRIDNIRVIPGHYFSSGGKCAATAIMEIKIHSFADWNNTPTPDYSPLARNEIVWHLIQRTPEGNIAFSAGPSDENEVPDARMPGSPESSTSTLNLNYSLCAGCATIALERIDKQQNSLKKEIEFYAAGQELAQILTIPLEFTVGNTNTAQGKFEIMESDSTPFNIKIYENIVRSKDTLSNTMEEYYWQGKHYELKHRKPTH